MTFRKFIRCTKVQMSCADVINSAEEEMSFFRQKALSLIQHTPLIFVAIVIHYIVKINLNLVNPLFQNPTVTKPTSS